MESIQNGVHHTKHQHHHAHHHHCHLHHQHHLQPHPTLITGDGKTKRVSNISTISIPMSDRSHRSSPGSDGSCPSTVQKEQYWMCSRRTKLEKLLMIAVLLLSIVIIAMTIAVAVLASDDSDSELYKFVMYIVSPLAKLHGKPRAVVT